MFTANSMNSLAEAIGLALPGNGSLLATLIGRKQLFVNAGKKIVSLAKKHYLKNLVLQRKLKKHL